MKSVLKSCSSAKNKYIANHIKLEYCMSTTETYQSQDAIVTFGEDYAVWNV